MSPATPTNWLLTKNTHRVFFLRSPLCSLSASRRIWLLSLCQDNESNMDLWRAKNEQLSFGVAKEMNRLKEAS
jgi:hypothetical protein